MWKSCQKLLSDRHYTKKKWYLAKNTNFVYMLHPFFFYCITGLSQTCRKMTPSLRMHRIRMYGKQDLTPLSSTVMPQKIFCREWTSQYCVMCVHAFRRRQMTLIDRSLFLFRFYELYLHQLVIFNLTSFVSKLLCCYETFL